MTVVVSKGLITKNESLEQYFKDIERYELLSFDDEQTLDKKHEA